MAAATAPAIYPFTLVCIATAKFYVLSAGVLVFGGLIAFDPAESFAGPEKWYMWGCLLALAVLPTVVSFVCTTVAGAAPAQPHT